MLFSGLSAPRCLGCACALSRFVTLAIGWVGSSASAVAQGAQPALTAEAARAAIAEVLATGESPGGLPLTVVLTAAAGLFAVTALALIAYRLTTCARALRHRAQGQALVTFTPLPLPVAAGAALSEAEALRSHAPITAVGRLYQGLLERLATDYQLQVSVGDTEPELVDRVARLRLSGLDDFTRRLAAAYEQARYAGEAPTDAAWASLCARWRRLFPTDVIP